MTNMQEIEPVWALPPASLEVSGDQVHLWRAWLDQPAAVGPLALHLSEDERDRAERFHFARDRQRFIIGRGLLRVLISRYTGLAPDRVAFAYGPGGKPYLAEQPTGAGLHFNVAHSHKLVLYAFTRADEIGVDVEFCRPISEMESIVARFFSPRELAAWRALPAEQQQTAFFNGWTRKEAYIKALGAGLAQPLDRFEVSLVPGRPAQLLRVADSSNTDTASRWSLGALRPAPSYIAAVALERPHLQLSYWQQS